MTCWVAAAAALGLAPFASRLGIVIGVILLLALGGALALAASGSLNLLAAASRA